MAYPTTLDDLDATRGTANDKLSTPNHVTHHALEDAVIEALQAKVGIDSSAVTTSHDYKLSGVTGSDKAVSKTGTETLTNKTLSTGTKMSLGSDATGDMYYNSGSGTLARIAVGTDNYIMKLNGTTPNWEAETAISNGSTTVAGLYEEATQAEVEGRTATGATGARLAMTTVNSTTVKTYDYIADAGANDTYAITCVPAPTAYVTGQVFRFKANTANTGACTLNVNSLGAVTIKKNVTVDLSTGDILANQAVEVIYDGTNFQMISTQQPRVQYANGGTTKDASEASATQNIAHGLGVIPKKVRITAMNADTGITNGTAPGFYTAMTVYNGTTQSSLSIVRASTTTVSLSTSFLLGTGNDAVNNNNTGVVTFDSTNIIITWTETGNGAGTYQLLWEAEA